MAGEEYTTTNSVGGRILTYSTGESLRLDHQVYASEVASQLTRELLHYLRGNLLLPMPGLHQRPELRNMTSNKSKTNKEGDLRVLTIPNGGIVIFSGIEYEKITTTDRHHSYWQISIMGKETYWCKGALLPREILTFFLDKKLTPQENYIQMGSEREDIRDAPLDSIDECFVTARSSPR